MPEVTMPPSSQEAEDAILGAIIEKPSLMNDVSMYLSPDRFYFEKNKRLYSILCSFLHFS